MTINTAALTTAINELTKSLNENEFILNGRKSIEDGIKSFEVADDEKAKLLANYEVQISLGFIKEVFQTAKELPELNARVAMITTQEKTEVERTNLLKAQITTEALRQKDLKASIITKNAAVIVSIQQAKFEEARRLIAIKANQQNVELKKADFKVQQLDAVATDADFIISATHFADVKTSIESISTVSLTYTSEITGTVEQITIEEIPVA